MGRKIAVEQAHRHAEAERSKDADDDRQFVIARQYGDRHGPRRDHRTDRDVELASDHQEPDGQGDDAEVGGEVQPARRTDEIANIDMPDDHIEGDHEDEAEHGAHFRAAQE